MTSRLEIITLAIELRDAANALAKLTCDTRIPDETLAAYLEAEVRPDYKALRKALKAQEREVGVRIPEGGEARVVGPATVFPSPSPQAEAEPYATAAVASARWRAAAAEEFASRTRGQRKAMGE